MGIARNQPRTARAVGPPPSGPARDAWAIVGLLMVFAGISHFNRISMAIAGDEQIMAQYRISPERMGWVYSAFLITYTACMIPGGWFIDRFGAKVALACLGFGSATFAALTGCLGLFVSVPGPLFAGLLVVRGLMGIVSTPLHPSCARMVGHWVASGNRSRANGLVTGAALAGIAATPPIFGALIAWAGWPAAFLVSGAATAILAVVWSLRAEERPSGTIDPRLDPAAPSTPGDAQPNRDLGWFGLIRDRSLILLTLSYAAIGYFQYLFFYWMNYYFQHVLKLPDGTRRFYVAIPPLAMAAAMPLGGWLSDLVERERPGPWGRRLVPMSGMLAGAALLVLGIFAREPAWIVTWFALALGAVGAAEGPFWATAIELGGRRGGASAALFNTGGNLGGLLAPILTPWIGLHYGWPWAVAAGSVICLAGSSLWLGVDVGGHREEQVSSPEIPV